MKSPAPANQESSSKSVANHSPRKKVRNDAEFQLADKRTETVAQLQLQEAIEKSPVVMQQKSRQAIANSVSVIQQKQAPVQKKENQTGLPDQLKSGVENLSGYSLDDVQVHYNSSMPAQLQAHAYAQGTEIHLAPGQEKHLPHEAWHVVQQKQGRVQPTLQMKGTVNVNDDAGLEKEADLMGAKALQMKQNENAEMHFEEEETAQLVLAPVNTGNTKVMQQAGDEAAAEQMAGAILLVDDGQQTSSGQMTKSAFLNQLKSGVVHIADQELAPLGQTAASCPFIEYWFSYYNKLNAAEVERAVHLYAPATAESKHASEIIQQVLTQVQETLHEQVQTGSLDPVDQGNPAELTAASGDPQSLSPPGKSELEPVSQLKENTSSGKLIQRKINSNVVQLGSKQPKTVPKYNVKIPRPAFRGAVKDMREDAKEMFPSQSIHMAHRLSWHSIAATLSSGDKAKIIDMINNLTIPQRNFGNPSSGGVAKGNKDYYNAIMALIAKYGIKQSTIPLLANALNSSPYNLRPGDGPTNSSIGADPDAHFDETLAGAPMTPQSRSLLPHTTVDSSDFMTMASFASWESNFYDDYVVPAITSVNKM